MKKYFYQLFAFFVFTLICNIAISQTSRDTVLIDFGDNLSPAPWNNLTDPVAGNINNLINAKNNLTGYNILVTDPFNNINRDGSTTPGAQVNMPPTATGDSFFGNVAAFGGQVQPTGGVTFANLDPTLSYSFEIFGSRAATDNRDTKFVLEGASKDSASLNTASNANNLVKVNMKPNSKGEIILVASPGENNNNGSKFYYLGAIRMTYPERALPPVVAAAADSILIDFGDNLSGSPWIDIINPVNGVAANLTTKRGKTTNYKLEVTDAFNNINRDGTKTPVDSIGFPATATGDSFFGNVTTFGGQIQTTGAVTFSDLNVNTTYEFTIFASRAATDNREAKYLFEGITKDSTALDASSNTSKVAKIKMKPSSEGKIVLTASPGANNNNPSKFFYLGAVIMSFVEGPPVSTIDTVGVDFGTVLSPSPWNNLESGLSGNLPDLLNFSNFNSGIGIRVTDPFSGVNTAGTPNPGRKLGLPASASSDSFFGNTTIFNGSIEPTGAVELYNLNPNKAYTISIFSSRTATDNRETSYKMVGKDSSEVFLNSSINTDSMVTATLKPNANGIISINVSAGPNNNNASKFYYLGALYVSYPKEVSNVEEITVTRPNGGEFYQVGRNVDITWKGRNIPEVNLEYSINNGTSWLYISKANGSIGKYTWTVPNTPSKQALVRVRGTQVSDVSDRVFEISATNSVCRIVVLGSSTAEGTGASPRDSSWVNRFAQSLASSTKYEVVNLGKGGYTTYHIIPNGAPNAGSGITTDTARNVNKALSLNPSIIIVNMPSNDAAIGFNAQEQMRNFRLIDDAAKANGVKVYICTPQPRNFTNPIQITIQTATRDSVLKVYGSMAIDFWTGMADTDGFILPQFNSGDGIHVNNAGHKLLFEKVDALMIGNSECGVTNTKLEEKIDYPQIMIYPNPADEYFTIDGADYTVNKVTLINYLGQKAFEVNNINAQTFKVKKDTIANGNYQCLISLSKGGKSILVNRAVIFR